MNTKPINHLEDKAKANLVVRQRTDRHLDEELHYRLDATLSNESKLELADVTAMADAQGEDEDEMPAMATESPHATAYEAESREGDGSSSPSASSRLHEGEGHHGNPSAGPTMGHAHDSATVLLATIAFRDGDALRFEAVPADGELGVAYLGQNRQRSLAVQAALASPIRVFASLAPADVPMPWLLPAIDRPPDRDALVGERQLCDRLDEPIRAVSEVLKLRVAGMADGWWQPEDLTVGGYCGWNGEYEFKDFCGLVGIGEPDPGPWPFFNIYKCTPELSTDVTHKSTSGGKWHRRRWSIAWVAACGSPVRITHQYRKLGFFQWKWVTATTFVKGPVNLDGTQWMGLARRRRRIIYTREGGIGGFRARSRFSQSYSD
jgi:hypothetical protein